MGRAPCCDKANVKRGPWSPEEDELLRNYIERNGTAGNWIALPQKAGLKRCGKSCRLRWLNYLRPDIRHGNFSEEEDNIICALYKSIGSRWSVIASHLHGRTDNDVKNYWNTKLKKRMMALESSQVQISQPETVLNTVIKPEEFINWSFENYGTSMEFYTEPSPLMPVSMNMYKHEVANYYATSTTTPESNSAASSSIENWSATDPFLSDLGFDSYTEFLNGYRQVV